jgi:hypothetical protein
MIRRSLPLILLALLAGCGHSSSSRASSSTASAVAATTSTSTGPVTTAAVIPANFQPVGFETLDVGSGSLVQVADEAHIGTDADWTFFWPSHSQAALPPSVDFTSESVVGTFLGQIGGGSHFTRVINVDRDTNSDDLHAVVREFRLGAWKPNTRILTSPYHLVRCATAVSGQGALTVDRQTLLDFETIAAGSDSAIGAGDPTYTGGLEVFRDGAAFNAFFAQVRPSVRPPAVDFQREMVVAVLGPYIARYGNSVETLRLVHDAKSDEIRVISRVNPYRGGAAPPPATETPFQIMRVTLASGTIRTELTNSVTQTPLASGTSTVYRGVGEALVIRDSATFATYWVRNIGGAAPAVDFAVNQVLIAFEPAANRTVVDVARSVSLEDDELSVTVNTQLRFGAPTTGSAYSIVTTPRTFGPVSFETVDTTPRP